MEKIMTPNIIKIVSIVGAALFAVAVVGVVFLVIGVDNPTLHVTLVALFAAGTSVGFYQRLTKRYRHNPETTEESTS